MNNLEFINKNRGIFNKIARSIKIKIPEETEENIRYMLFSSVFETGSKNFRTIKYHTLERLLEEIGLNRIRGKWSRILDKRKHVSKLKTSFHSEVNDIITESNLTQEELLIICLFFQLDPPEILEDHTAVIKGINKLRPLKAKDVSEITGFSIAHCYYVKRKAIRKIKDVGRRFHRAKTYYK